MRNTNAGITLVALVITVIVLVILAGVTLSTLVGDNGIITKAQEAKQNMENATAEEDELIQNLLNEIKEVGEGSEGEPEIPDVGISFGEIIWENGKAKITIQSSEEGKKIQYQINGEGGEWKDIENGGTIGELVHGDKIYARLYDESGSGGSIIKRIEDKIAPKVQVKVGEITGTSIEVEVTATENESGLAEIETYRYYIGEAIMGRTTSNIYKYTELSEETEYKLTVIVTDKAGNEGKGEATATTMEPEPTGWKFVTCLTTNTEYKVPKNGTYRITCIGKSADGAGGGKGWYSSYEVRPTVTHSTIQGGAGGNGGGAGGIARSILSLKTTEKVHCTIDTTISSFGDYLSASAGNGITGGIGTGGNDFNTTGNNGGNGGNGGNYSGQTGDTVADKLRLPTAGGRGLGNGAFGGNIITKNDQELNNVGGRKWRRRRYLFITFKYCI